MKLRVKLVTRVLLSPTPYKKPRDGLIHTTLATNPGAMMISILCLFSPTRSSFRALHRPLRLRLIHHPSPCITYLAVLATQPLSFVSR